LGASPSAAAGQDESVRSGQNTRRGYAQVSLVLVTLGNVAVAAAQWYLIWLFARESGPAAVGQYSSLIALTTPIFITAQLGLRNLYITLRRFVRWSIYLALRAAGILVATLLVLGVVLVVSERFSLSLALAILSIKIFDSGADLYFARLQREEKLLTYGAITLANAGGTVVVATALIMATGSIVAGVWGSAVVSAAALAAAVILAPPAAQSPSVDNPSRELRVVVAAGVPLALSHGIYSVLSYLPIAVVGWFGSTSDVGLYTSAAYLVVFANLVGASAQTVVLPSYRRLFDASGGSTLLRHASARSFITAASLSPLVLLAILVGPMLLVLVYGPEFVLSRTTVLLLALAAVIALPTYLMSAVLLVYNRYWVMTLVGAGSIVIVVLAGVLAGVGGLGAVESGSLAVLTGSVARFAGVYVLSRTKYARPEDQ
jgi:O-antigen/teichoic acid export membrane protein